MARKITAPSFLKSPVNQQIWYTIILVAWTLLAFTASQFIVGLPLLLVLGEQFHQTVWTGTYYALTYLLTVILTIFLPAKIFQIYQKSHPKRQQSTQNLKALLTTTPNQLGVDQYPTFVDLGLVPIGYIAYLFLASVALNFMRIFSWFDTNQAQITGFTFFVTNLERCVAILALVFIAPVAEELIMRGWLYGKLRDKLKLPIAILIVSILFAVLHGQWNVGVGVFVLSIILCSLRELTGTIWSGVLLHILVNGIAFYVSYVRGF